MFCESSTSLLCLWTDILVWDLNWSKRTRLFFSSCHYQWTQSHLKCSAWNLKTCCFGGLWYFWWDLCDHCVYESTTLTHQPLLPALWHEICIFPVTEHWGFTALGISDKRDEGHEWLCLWGTDRSEAKGCQAPLTPRSCWQGRSHPGVMAGTQPAPYRHSELLLQITLELSAGASDMIEAWSFASPGRSRTSASTGGCSPGALQPRSEQAPSPHTGRDLLPVLLLGRWWPQLFFIEGLHGEKMCRESLYKLTKRVKI